MNISSKKLELAKADIIKSCGCERGCPKCSAKLVFADKMFEACIPVMYWPLKMSDFKGAPNIKEAVNEYVSGIDAKYKEGVNICLSGTLGTGKTYSMANILKAALAKNYTAHYTSLSEMINGLTNNLTKFSTGNLLMSVDFLGIDEVDSRHISQSDAAQDFFGGAFERILRFRFQNKLPTILATNNASLDEAFGRQFKKTIESLSAKSMVVVAALGKDFRMTGDSNG